MLKVKRLDPRATLPTVAHPGEDIAYDLYALEDTLLSPETVTKVRTGIAVAAYKEKYTPVLVPIHEPLGLLIRDRSSIASRGIFTHGGVIDSGYRGEIIVLLAKEAGAVDCQYEVKDVVVIKAGDKIAQMIPVPVLTGPVEEVEELSTASRGDKGFGSSGR